MITRDEIESKGREKGKKRRQRTKEEFADKIREEE